MIVVNNLTWDLGSLQSLDLGEKDSDIFPLALGGCALSKTCSLQMQCALNENMGFGVLWNWVQILIPAWIGCVILSKFYELCKPVSSFKVGRKIITSTAWNEVLSHMQSTYCRTKHLLRAQYTFI